MDGDTSPGYPVYIGFWTNWSSGKVFGATLTLTRSDSNLLIAFLSFFVTVVTTSLWAILSQIFHAYLSTPNARDTLHHQRQAILRNNSGPTNTMWTLLRLGYTWRKSPGTKRRILPLLVISTIILVGFVAAAGFSSRVSQGTEVLIKAGNCKTFQRSAASENDFLTKVEPWIARDFDTSAIYAQQCYKSSNTPASMSPCSSTFVQKQIQVSIDGGSKCPFDPALCTLNTSNLILDTGLIDTHVHLGLNAPPEERIQFRRLVECAPLTTRGYSDSFNSTNGNMFTRYYYGPGSGENYTYMYPNIMNTLSLWDETQDNEFGGTEYTFESWLAQPYNDSYTSPKASEHSNFVPIPGLQQNDANVFIIFMSSNAIDFLEPTADPWYNSSQKAIYSFDGTNLYATEPANPLACHYREQWCLPGLPAGRNCTAPVGTMELQRELLAIVTDNSTWNRIHWVQNTLVNAADEMQMVAFNLGTQALTSRFTRYGVDQGLVAANQWQQDVEYWNAVNLASIQQSFVSTATDDVPDIPEALFPYANEEEYKICSSQKIMSPLHNSFSVFGLAFIGILGLIIIILSLCMDTVVHCIHKRLKLHAHSRLEWRTMGALQLQRLAHEELGLGSWSACDQPVPVTQPNTFLGVLDISDETHPLICVPDKQEGPGAEKISQENTTMPETSEEIISGEDGDRRERCPESILGGAEEAEEDGESSASSGVATCENGGANKQSARVGSHELRDRDLDI